MLLRGGETMRKIILSLLALLMAFLIVPLSVNASGHIDSSNDITPIERINSLKEYSDYQGYQDNEVIVRFKPAAAQNFSIMHAVHMEVGASVKRAFSLVEGLQIVRLDKGVSVDRAVQRYRHNPMDICGTQLPGCTGSNSGLLTDDSPDVNGIEYKHRITQARDESEPVVNEGDYNSEEDIIDDDAREHGYRHRDRRCRCKDRH